MNKFLVLISIVLSTLIAGVAEPDLSTTRARGLSNAFIGLSNDEGALFYNPAGLAYVDSEYYHQEKDIVRILEEGPRSHMNSSLDFLFNMGYFQALEFIGNNQTFDSRLVQFNTGLDKKAYSKRAINLSLYSYQTGFTLYVIENVEHRFRNTQVVSDKDLQFVGILGRSFEIGRVSLGISGRGVLMSRQHNSLTYATLNSLSIQNGLDFENAMFDSANNPSIMNGVGFAANVGVMTEWNNFRLGIAMENIVATDIELNAIKGTVTQNLNANEDWAIQNLRAGVSYSNGDLVVAFDIHNLNRGAEQVSYHVGLEKDIINFWILPQLRARAGLSMSQQFIGYSGGMAFRVGIIQVNLSYLERQLNIDKINDANLTESKDQQANLNFEISF